MIAFFTCNFNHLLSIGKEKDMIDIEKYILQLIESLRCKFGARLLYVGLQGSYLRGEATDRSDIDIMVVIDELTVSDMDQYRAIIRSMEHSDKSCGFICSRSDLANWNPLELWNLVNGTRDYYGALRELIPAYTELDTRNFAKVSLNNLYHEICHRYIHASPDRNAEALSGTYKGVFFILQTVYYLRHGQYIATKAELLPLLEGKDRAVMERALSLEEGASYDFSDSFTLLFTWCQQTLTSL